MIESLTGESWKIVKSLTREMKSIPQAFVQCPELLSTDVGTEGRITEMCKTPSPSHWGNKPVHMYS